jgi:hypothetical protein
MITRVFACVALTAAAQALAQSTEPKLIAIAAIPALAADRSGLTGPLGPMPHDRFGSFGSAIELLDARTGRYLVLADRGPQDGAWPFACRWHELLLPFDAGAPTSTIQWISPKLIKTTLLTNIKGQQFNGASASFQRSGSPALDLRLDPEAVRVSPVDPHVIYIADEYRPAIMVMNQVGVQIGNIDVPQAFAISRRDRSAEQEDNLNISGRVANRGFEGLAISPNADMLFALPQSPLIQDGGRQGVFVRLLCRPIKPGSAETSGSSTQLVYQLDDSNYGLNEILALSDTTFLVIERDGREGLAAGAKWIMHIDIGGATDVSAIDRLPKRDLPAGVVPVKKTRLLDLLKDQVTRAMGDDSVVPEKIEGLAQGPTLADGRETFWVTSDNDFRDDAPTWLWLFAMPAK